MKIKYIERCRLCGKETLTTLVDLGEQKLTGVFPAEGEEVEGGRLKLVKCTGDGGCGLVQLDRSFESELMYGDNYGYRSGLNKSMVLHLSNITKYISRLDVLREGDSVVDIGSNDGTLLGTYKDNIGFNLDKIGIDPTSKKFKKYYDKDIRLIEDFFSSNAYKTLNGSKKARVVTSIAMFYDLEDPINFAKQIREIMEDDGIWIAEQSYFPSMIDACSYDTICHEHVEYYSLKQIQYIAENAGLRIIDVSLNRVNGGSFMVTLCKENAKYDTNDSVKQFVEEEQSREVDSVDFTSDFVKQIQRNKDKLLDFLNEQKKLGKLVLGYGASTKGNVVLQHCNINQNILPAIAEVNSDKFGKHTPGTGISIISEEDAKEMKPDYFLVLPWHFRDNILSREQRFREESGCKFVFALPKFEIV